VSRLFVTQTCAHAIHCNHRNTAAAAGLQEPCPSQISPVSLLWCSCSCSLMPKLPSKQQLQVRSRTCEYVLLQLLMQLFVLQRKTQEELEVMHYANQVASAAHVQVCNTSCFSLAIMSLLTLSCDLLPTLLHILALGHVSWYPLAVSALTTRVPTWLFMCSAWRWKSEQCASQVQAHLCRGSYLKLGLKPQSYHRSCSEHQ